MANLNHIAGGLLMLSVLGLAGCPVGMDRRDGRDGGQSAEQRRRDDDRNGHGDSRRDDHRDRDARPTDDSPR